MCNFSSKSREKVRFIKFELTAYCFAKTFFNDSIYFIQVSSIINKTVVVSDSIYDRIEPYDDIGDWKDGKFDYGFRISAIVLAN